MAESAAPAIMKRYDGRTRLFAPCPKAAPGEVVVCGRQDDRNERNGLPLRGERAATGRLPGEPPRASAERVRQGSCGIVAGDPPHCNLGLIVVKTRF